MEASRSISASCHCGKVTLRLASKPGYINECNCSLCASHAAWWGYYQGNDVQVDGTTRGYVRVDYADPAVMVHFCPDCGCTTHWAFTESFAASHPTEIDRMGVNMRLFAVAALDGVELRFPDGRGWDGQGDFGYVREPVFLHARE